MAEFYTLETIREQVNLNGWSINSVYPSIGTRPFDAVENFPPDWNYCPCSTERLCITRHTRECIVRVGISTGNPKDTSLFIEVIFQRENHMGIIRMDQMLLNTYITLGRINRNALETIIL